MSYEKQTWTTGEVITQEKLNHMEDGIAEANGKSTSANILIVTFTTVTIDGSRTSYCDKTYEEILNAINNGDIVIGRYSTCGCLQVYKQENGDNKFEIWFYLGYIVQTNVTKLSIEKFVIHSDNTLTHESVGYIGE